MRIYIFFIKDFIIQKERYMHLIKKKRFPLFSMMTEKGILPSKVIWTQSAYWILKVSFLSGFQTCTVTTAFLPRNNEYYIIQSLGGTQTLGHRGWESSLKQASVYHWYFKLACVRSTQEIKVC